MADIKIFVADDVNEGGLEPLRSAGFEVEKRTGLKGEELAGAVGGADGLVVRSETKVTAKLLESLARLRVIGRAGVGVDNIDVAAATEAGVVVMNAPDGNTMTTAEHTLALLLALARRVPQGNASLRAGRWERKKFIGTELRGKTLGVVGLGRIGRVVASRARGFEMRVVAFDPFVAPEQVRDAEIELAPLEEVCARADFLTVHTPLTPETRGIVGAKELARAERLGRFQAQLIDEPVRSVEIEYAGEAASSDASPVTRSFLAGLLRNMSARVNVVNALVIAEERGITVTVAQRHGAGAEAREPVRTRVRTVAGEHTVAGALFGQQSDGRITEIDGFRIEAIPAGHMLVTRSSDVPGVIGRVGTILGDHGVNISRFHLGRRERGGEAMAVVEADAPLDEATLEELRSFGPVISARRIVLE